MHRATDLQIADLAELFELNSSLRSREPVSFQLVAGGRKARGRAMVIALLTRLVHPLAMLFIRRQCRINNLLIYGVARAVMLDNQVAELSAKLQKLEQDLEAARKN